MSLEDEQNVNSQSWNKLSTKLYKEGFREGSAAGREKSFQKGFDIGYELGYQTGYYLGNHNGVLRILENNDISIPEEADGSRVMPHEKPYRGLCQLCPKSKEEENNIEFITSNSVQELVNSQNLVKTEIRSHLKPCYAKRLKELEINVSIP